MDYKSISAGELSSLLDVQRSNISHILNGRNKPGATFIEKFLLSFPNLNARWLLTGDGEMVDNKELKDTTTLFSQKDVTIKDKPFKQQNDIQFTNEAVKNDDKPINKVVILYSDGTFTDYNRK